MMTWKKYTVEQLIDLDMLEAPMDGNHGSIHPKASDYVLTGVPFIMVNDISNGHVDLKNCAFISEKQAATLRKGFAKPGDVLLSHKATIGRTAIVPNDFNTIILTPQITYYRVKKGIDNRFLKYYFDSPNFQSLFNNWAGSGSTRAYLGITAQRKLPIILPELDEQIKIADILSSLDEKIHKNNEINNNLPPHPCYARIAAKQLRQTPKTDECLHTDGKMSDRGGNEETAEQFSSLLAA